MAEKHYRTSQLASALLTVKGNPLSLEDYIPFKQVYDYDPPLLVAKCGRQIGKSLSIGAITTSKSIGIPFYTTFYIAPLAQQTSRFSTMYLDPFMNSPLVRKHFRDTGSKKNVFEKSLNNGSIIFLSYAETENDADRARGIAADSLNVDEVQDVSVEALPILFETLSASQYGFKRLYGTAKGENNTLEIYFKKTNGLEWATRCGHCGKYNIPWTYEDCLKMLMSRTDGPGCVHCGGSINVREGKWVATRPDIKDAIGFHIPQIVIPARTTPKKWKELREKAENVHYGPIKMANEVFGLASGSGNRILSIREAVSCCDSTKKEFDTGWPMDQRGINTVVVGVDWSVTGGVASYTVVTVYGFNYLGQMFNLYSERLQGIDILEQVRRVIQIYHQFNAQAIGSDRGVGVLQGQLMQEALGADKVLMVQYVAAKLPLRWDTQGQFMSADRTMAIDSVILKMKIGMSKFCTPSWDFMGNYWKDALAVYEEESHSGRRLYRKDPDIPDDWLHSTVFAHVAYMYVTGQYKVVDGLPGETGIGV